ncbi:MAG: M48 family metalloprotease, partial [Nitrospirae bacterium]|nr:M48 family metalloprotease [Nitrospirota bacterium]
MIWNQKGRAPFLLKVIGLLILVSLTRCALPSPRQVPPEARLSPIAVPEDETRSKKLGKEFLVEARKQFVFVKDPEVIQAVNEIGRSILAANGEDPQSFHFLVVKNSVPNAFAVPGGYIFVFDGLLSRMN